MPSSKTEAYIGLDVAKASHAVAIAEAGRDGEVRKLGTISSSPDAVGRLVKRLEARHSELHFFYEVGPTGYGLYRQLTQMGHACTVVAPSLVPMRSGDRVKTDPARRGSVGTFAARRRTHIRLGSRRCSRGEVSCCRF